MKIRNLDYIEKIDLEMKNENLEYKNCNWDIDNLKIECNLQLNFGTWKKNI